jgi:hypothetical protein
MRECSLAPLELWKGNKGAYRPLGSPGSQGTRERSVWDWHPDPIVFAARPERIRKSCHPCHEAEHEVVLVHVARVVLSLLMLIDATLFVSLADSDIDGGITLERPSPAQDLRGLGGDGRCGRN